MAKYNDKANKETGNECILPGNSDNVNIGPANKYVSGNKEFPFLINICWFEI